MRVLVIGATGKVGSSLISGLLELGADVRAFVRTGTEIPPRWGSGQDDVEVVTGELADRAFLPLALAGCDSLFLTSPHSPEMPELHRNVIDAAKHTGARVVRLSGWTPSVAADSHAPGGRGHWLVEQYLSNSGLPHTTLRVNYFLQNIAARNAQVIREKDVFVGPLADAHISMIDTEDVGAAAAGVLGSDEHHGTMYTLTGPAAVSYADVAQGLTEMLGREVKYVDMQPEQFRQWMLESGRKAWEADHALALFAIYRAGLGETVTTDVELLAGRPASSLQQYLQQNLAAFTKEQVYAS
jgi:uncharacterized protein YbjT (DUF2867 family)